LALYLLLFQKFSFLGSRTWSFGWALEGDSLTSAGKL
jgi:hypothetical protein